MPRSSQASEFNTFVGGLITEASPLTYPENTALDINNFELSKTGTISRRLGMDYEANHVVIDSGVSPGLSDEVAITSFKWVNAGGFPSLYIVVVQVGSILKFYSTSEESLSGGLLHTYDTGSIDQTIIYSGTVIDGVLVVTTGAPDILKFEYSSMGVISEETYRLKIRDVFGVEYSFEGIDLREPDNVNYRPMLTRDDYNSTDNSPYLYNKRNSSWGVPRLSDSENATNLQDPITMAVVSVGVTEPGPATSDSVLPYLFADPSIAVDRFTKRFFDQTYSRSSAGTSPAAMGYFIIDLLERGASREAQVAKNEDVVYDIPFGWNGIPIADLPQDITSGGASVVREFAGRAWYAGFRGDVIDGDRHSPRLSSYVTYSKLVEGVTDLGACHSLNDPTSAEQPDPLDTDGGFIRLDGAYNIQEMVNIGQALVVIAENGVWAILGGSDYGFTALDNKVVKITEHGCTSKGSVVLVDGTVMYWGDDGIYHIKPSESGGLVEANLSNTTIQTLFDGVDSVAKTHVKGIYDSFERKVKWLYGNQIGEMEDTIELVLDLNLSAFYKHTIPGVASGNPNVVLPIEVPPFRIGEVTTDVYDGEEQVFYNAEAVVHTGAVIQPSLKETVYLSTTVVFPTVLYTFSKYRDETFTDWITNDGIGIDSPAFLLTGYNGGGDYQRYKQVPYVTFHFNKTEDGFFTDEEDDIYPTHPSSCLVQAQWEWANSAQSGRWGREFQAYRFKRPFIPENATSDFDNGFATVVTKSKLRGKGKVLSLLIKTEPLKDCQLLGWSMITSAANNI